jgi:hypothetical protein
MGTIGIIIIAVIVFILIFLILREVNCWYWKINERISLMNEQNDLLKRLISGQFPEKVGLVPKTEKFIKNQNEEIKNNVTPNLDTQINLPGITAEILNKLSDAKKHKLERLIEDMENTDIIVFHDNTVKLLSKERWDGIVNSGASDKYEIIYKSQLN